MHEILQQFLAQLRGMWRFRWPALGVSWLVCLAGWAWVYSLPNQYESTTRVYVDTDSALRPLLKGLTPETNVLDQVNLMTRALLSTPQLEKVARETDLDLRASTPGDMEKLIERLRRSIDIRGSRRDNLYSISFRDTDPRMAQNVVQTMLGTFVGDTLKTNRNEAGNALRFLEEQITEYEVRLVEAEQRLADFKKRHVGMMPGVTGDYYERLQAEMATLDRLKVEYRLAQNSRTELLKQLQGEVPVFGITGSPAASNVSTPYDDRIAALREKLSDYQLNYTDKHPDVIALRETIGQLEAQRDEALSKMAPAPGGAVGMSSLDMNPVYQSMRIELSRTEVQVTQLRTRLGQQQSVVESLRKSVDTIPEIEAQLSRLNRDYDVTKTQYEKLLQRRESARLGEDADQSNDDIKFRIIEPPPFPLEPVGPNRQLFLSMALLGGLAAGLAFTFLMNQVRPVFSSPNELREITGLPVLGTVRAILMPRRKLIMRMQTAAFAVGLFMLGLTYGGALFFQESAVEFAQALQFRSLM